MCVSPIRIRNPNLGSKSKLKDTSSSYINVPCGVCAECVKRRQMDLVQRFQVESIYNEFFFTTLTYNNEMLPSISVGDYEIKYADISDVQNMIKRLRKSNKLAFPFRYFAVSELGSTRGRPHFHIIWMFKKSDLPDLFSCMNFEKKLFSVILSEWVRNVGSLRSPIYMPLCTYIRKVIHGQIKTNFDTHYINPSLTKDGTSNVSWYVLKYLLKPSNRAIRLQQALHMNLDEDSYNSLWSIVKPRYFKSLGFGLTSLSPSSDVIKMIRDNSQKFRDSFPYPIFINQDGSSFPLARYYKTRGDIFSENDALYLRNKFPNPYGDIVIEDRSQSELDSIISRFDSSVALSDSHGSDDDFEFIFDD